MSDVRSVKGMESMGSALRQTGQSMIVDRSGKRRHSKQTIGEMSMLTGKELEKKNAGYKAAEYIKDGMILGLGTGSTAYYAIIRAGELVKEGYLLKAVATSKQTAEIAAENGVEILDIDDVDHIDLAIDGVDEIDHAFNAIKGGGGALFREKIVATLAKEVIWIMDEKNRSRRSAISRYRWRSWFTAAVTS